MADKKSKSRGLGRGLSALMAEMPRESGSPKAAVERSDLMVPIEQIKPNPDQPRRHFETEALIDLAESIREKGVIQPIIVRPYPGQEGVYQIVAGERRWRASQKAQLHQVPVIIREFDDIEVLEVAIIENIQRADLNPVEEARGYRQLIDKFGHTQEKLAQALGKSRSHIANQMRLLALPDEVLTLLNTGALTAGHARALITAENPVLLAREIVKKGLSVRGAEQLVKKESAPAPKPRPARTLDKDADTLALEADLSAALGMKVSLNHAAGGESGQLTIRYDTLDALDALCAKLS
ncbi:ParB/RepB/Spo0J family partition protein [uncultured Lentibacter sp.]|uniref:ParB/RepB/Spo0J family partition protein n=1 Tax=uncultured Lentibacter sp. TaxID=1659309 RepID=UPI002604E7E2|nr:ParB/RepB/Spo0J family partition protein [uncultured Lentibacter sp.]